MSVVIEKRIKLIKRCHSETCLSEAEQKLGISRTPAQARREMAGTILGWINERKKKSGDITLVTSVTLRSIR